MADSVYLGPIGDEGDPLPNVMFIGGTPAWPVSTNKQAEGATMSDRSLRWAFFGTLKVFQIEFGFLATDQLNILKAKNELNQILHYKNEHEEDVWYRVVIATFNHEPERVDIRHMKRYKASMTLEETDMALRD